MENAWHDNFYRSSKSTPADEFADRPETDGAFDKGDVDDGNWPSQLSPQNRWKLGDKPSSHLKFNELSFTNRASCAEDSTKPSRSMFIIIDGLNVAKGAYKLAQDSGEKPEFLVPEAAYRFRYSTMQLINLITRNFLVENFHF